MMSRLGTPHLIIGWIIIVALGMLALLAPQWRVIRNLEARVASLDQMVDDSEDVDQKIESISTWVNEVEVEVRQLTIEIPEESDVSGLIRSLSAKLGELGIRDREITTGSPQENSEASFLPMSIVLVGEFPSIFATIKWIEAQPRLLRIRRVRCDRIVALDSNRSITRAELLLDAFFAPKSLSDHAENALLLGSAPEGP